MVEFALVLPVLLLVLLAILKFGLLFNNYITMTDAVRIGARQLSVGRGSTDPCAAAVTATVNAATSINLTGDVTTSITNDSANGTTCPTATDLVSGNSAKVTATYPYSVSLMGISFFSGNLSASATERIE